MNTDWQQILQDRLPLYGHRNWIVIADSAYPAQSRGGIETIVADAEQTTVLERALDLIGQCNHIKPTIFTDKELALVPESDAPGVTSYREQLAKLLSGHEASVLPHDEIIAKLDQVGETFRVLLLKTNMCIPCTSVFLQLECGYWNADAEKRLRAGMKPKTGPRKAAKRKAKR